LQTVVTVHSYVVTVLVRGVRSTRTTTDNKLGRYIIVGFKKVLCTGTEYMFFF